MQVLCINSTGNNDTLLQFFSQYPKGKKFRHSSSHMSTYIICTFDSANDYDNDMGITNSPNTALHTKHATILQHSYYSLCPEIVQQSDPQHTVTCGMDNHFKYVRQYFLRTPSNLRFHSLKCCGQDVVSIAYKEVKSHAIWCCQSKEYVKARMHME